MIEEARVFAAIMQDPTAHHEAYQELLTLAQGVNLLLYKMRKQVDVSYAADKE